MKRTALIITGVVFIMLASWSISNTAQDITVMGFLNINYASVEELQMLPGINEATAKNIVSFREVNGPFFIVDELINVTGMNVKRFELIRPYLRVEGKTTLRVIGL